jgi:Uri superfamily endonuclease
MKGAYLLVIKLPVPVTIRIGRKGPIAFKQGCYAYIGSALNGLDQRIHRHLRTGKKLHWHVDYLLGHACVTQVFIKENDLREECKLVESFHDIFEEIPGFGCSDCSCSSHLFFGPETTFEHTANSLGMKLYPLNANS